jgi:hypothetical protein
LFYTHAQSCQNGCVRRIELKVADLYNFEGTTPDSNPDGDAISALALKHFSFLPQPLTVHTSRTTDSPPEARTA